MFSLVPPPQGLVYQDQLLLFGSEPCLRPTRSLLAAAAAAAAAWPGLVLLHHRQTFHSAFAGMDDGNVKHCVLYSLSVSVHLCHYSDLETVHMREFEMSKIAFRVDNGDHKITMH